MAGMVNWEWEVGQQEEMVVVIPEEKEVATVEVMRVVRKAV